MMTAYVAVAVMSVSLLWPAVAVAQEPVRAAAQEPVGTAEDKLVADRRMSVYANIGMGHLTGDGGEGNGPDLGGGFAYQFSSRIAAAGDIDYWRHNRRLTSGATHEGSGLFVTGNLVVYFFQERRHQLYLLGGGGLGRYQPEDQPPQMAPGPP